MFSIRRKALLSFLALALTAWFAAEGYAGEKEKGFKNLIGKDMSSFQVVGGSDKTWKVEEGIVRCTGRPNGYFATKKSYKNYVLRFDFRYRKNPGNSGYLIHITGKHKVWPKCIEVQGQYSNVCMIFPIGGVKGPRPKVNSDVRNKIRKPHQEWNSVEIISKNGGLTAKLNGETICQSEEGAYDVREGQIGFQSEGAPIDFRNLRIRVMD